MKDILKKISVESTSKKLYKFLKNNYGSDDVIIDNIIKNIDIENNSYNDIISVIEKMQQTFKVKNYELILILTKIKLPTLEHFETVNIPRFEELVIKNELDNYFLCSIDEIENVHSLKVFKHRFLNDCFDINLGEVPPKIINIDR